VSSDLNKVKKNLIVIVGPTAIGKSAITVELAKYFGTVVINADSRQVYKEMSIGTAKPLKEEMAGIKHYFIGDRGLKTPFNAGLFEKEALSVLEHEFRRKDVAILSGGSGMYIQAVCRGFDNMPGIDSYVRAQLNEEFVISGLQGLMEELQKKDPEYAEVVDEKNPHRIIRALEVIRATDKTYTSFRKNEWKERPFQTIKIGLNMDRTQLNERINNRMDDMIRRGLFEEVKSLKPYSDLAPLQTVGYQEIFSYLEDKAFET